MTSFLCNLLCGKQTAVWYEIIMVVVMEVGNISVGDGSNNFVTNYKAQ